jgi:hypothetical protein
MIRNGSSNWECVHPRSSNGIVQALAARIYEMTSYKGIRWWSFYRPGWRVWCLWEISPIVETVDELSLEYPAVNDAAEALAKPRRV